MKKTILLPLLLLAMAATAQVDRSFGIRTGLNFNRIDGPSAAGEEWKNLVGFNIAASLGWHFSDYFELRTELAYTKKGGKYKYQGPTYFNFKATSGPDIRASGTGLWSMNINNSYFELPVLAVGRYKRFELLAGPSIAALIASSADGELVFTGMTGAGTKITDYNWVLAYDFRRDGAGDGSGDLRNLALDGQTVQTPSLLGAYHQYPTKDKALYKAIDFGINVGAAVYLTHTLWLGARANWGLTDISNNASDRDLSAPDAAGKPIFRKDDDRNFTLSANLGFSF